MKTELLISMLIPNAGTDYNHGWNAALIELLQNNESFVTVREHQILKAVLFDTQVKEKDFSLFVQYRKENSKLGAVKLLKDLTGLGLRETKELIDQYWELMTPRE